jgi:HK97 gp10 family phage protein
LRQGANLIAKQVRATAPVKTGRLRKSIKVKNSRINRINKNGKVGVYITIYKGKSRDDKKGAWYGSFVNNGYKRGSKAVTGRQAVHLGVISNEQLSKKKAEYLVSRRKGKSRMGIRYRYGGKAMSGNHFVERGFDASKDQATRLIIEAFEIGVDRLAKQIGLKG